MSFLRQTAINSSWLVAVQVLRLALNFIVGILIARHYGPAGLGLFSYGQVLVQMLLPVATFGMPDILVREFSSGKRDAETVLASALGLRLALSLLGLAAIMLVALVLRGPDAAVMTVVFGYGLSFIPQSFDVMDSRFQSLDRVGALSMFRMLNGLVFTAIRLGAVYLAAPIEVYAYLYSTEIGAFAILSIIIGRRNGIRIIATRADPDEVRFLLRASAPLLIRLVATAIYMRIDQIMIQHFLGDEQMGVYSAAVRITELWYFVPVAIVAGAAPSLTRHYNEDEAVYTAALGRLMRIMLLLSLLPAVCFTLGAPYIIALLFGPAYAAAAPVLAIQTWAGVFVAIGVATTPWFINTGQLRFGVYQAVAGALVSTILNALLIPRFGLIGAALSVVISYGISAVAMNACFAATRGLFMIQMRALVLR